MPTPLKKTPALNSSQRVALLSRVNRKRQLLQSHNYKAIPEPARVTNARKIVEAWGDHVNAVKETQAARLEVHLRDVHEAIEFAKDADSALAAVKKFETLKL